MAVQRHFYADDHKMEVNEREENDNLKRRTAKRKNTYEEKVIKLFV